MKGYEKFECLTSTDGSFYFKNLYPLSDYNLLPQSANWTTDTVILVKTASKRNISILPSPIMIRFIMSKLGTITDTKTLLMWEINENGKPLLYQDAIKYCTKLDLGGYSDWRLPSIEEIQSLIDKSKKPVFDTRLFPNRKDTLYWTSTANQDKKNLGNTAVLNMHNGEISYVLTDTAKIKFLLSFNQSADIFRQVAGDFSNEMNVPHTPAINFKVKNDRNLVWAVRNVTIR